MSECRLLLRNSWIVLPPRNGGKPVHKGCHQMTQWPQPCANRVPATSLTVHTRTWLMCCFLFCCRGRSAWPRLTTPKELWLLWILSSCNITWNVSHVVLLAIIMIATFCLGKVNYVSMSIMLFFIVLLKWEWRGFDRPVYREWKAAQLKIFSWTLRGFEPNEMLAGF